MSWMNILDAASNLLSVAVAIAALAWSYKAFRTQREASAVPRLSLIVTFYEDFKQIRLVNCGVGVAVINAVEFRNGDTISDRNVAEIFELPFPADVSWDTWRSFLPDEPTYIPPGKAIVLLQLTEKNLIAQGCNHETASKLLRQWQETANRVEFSFRYQDIYENNQPEYKMKVRPVTTRARRGDSPILDSDI